jgi:6-phosphogluconolactonase
MMEIHVYKDEETLAGKMAAWMAGLIRDTLKGQEFFTLALSGGETPKILFRELATRYAKKIPWKRIHIFWGDERVVPFSDARNNAHVAFELLISQVEIPADQVHVIRTDIEPVFAAKEYEKMLKPFFEHTLLSFDLILLGLGDDGHTLSLFPGSALLENTTGWVSEAYHPVQKMYRITLLPSLVNRAAQIAFMVDGNKKATVVSRVIEGKFEPQKYPAQIIRPEKGQLHFFLDEAAAAKLKK